MLGDHETTGHQGTWNRFALQQTGVPLDPVFATRASLLDECGEAYFASNSEAKRRFHRTLVELNLIDCDAATSSLPQQL